MRFEPNLKTAYHDYSDQLTSLINEISCYDNREVLSEKLRAMIQRSHTAPRDYYDIWYLSKLQILAPLGLDNLFNLIVRPTGLGKANPQTFRNFSSCYRKKRMEEEMAQFSN